MRLGIIGSNELGSSLLSCLSSLGHEVFLSENHENNIEVIGKTDIIFCCVTTEILPSNIYDIKNVMDVVEDFGVAFEQEIYVTDKILVICSTLNPGDTKEINEILSPMNMKVCYLPFIFKDEKVLKYIQNQEKIIIGSIDPQVVELIGNIVLKFQNGSPTIVSMTSKSAELCKLALNSFIAYKINFANMVGELLLNYNLQEEIKIVLTTLSGHNVVGNKNFDYGFGYGGPILPSDNRVFGEFCNRNKIEFVLPYVTEDFNKQHNHFLKKYFVSQNPNKSEPFVIDGLGYNQETDSYIESSKLNLVYDLLREGYIVHILENEKFIRESKLPKEMINDFSGRVKFFKKGTNPKGIYITT